MKQVLKTISIGGLAIASYLAGYWHKTHGGLPPVDPPSARVLYYRDPMHPAYKSDKPGIAPDCGMQLEPVYADAAAAGLSGQPLGGPSFAVNISPQKQQLIGVKTDRVAKGAWAHTIRVSGKVALDDNRVFKLLGATDGWVRQLCPITAGHRVRKDDLLATFAAREFVAAQQAYLYALSTLDRYQQSGKESPDQITLTTVQVQSAFDNLRALGMGELQLEQIARSRKAITDIEIRSPVGGVVLARNLSPSTRFERGSEMYRIADLSRIWILAQTFDGDTQYFHAGQKVRVRSRNRVFEANVGNTLPSASPETRTRTVRLEAANPDLALTPDMFVDVELSVTLPPAVNVPAEAVIDSGLHQTVFVARGNGYFEPRAVVTGWRFGDRVEIVRGLQVGESIVISGNFLIDSESRMKAAGQPGLPPAMNGAITDPSCGMEVDPQTATEQSTYNGKTYYFCSRSCREKFEQVRRTGRAAATRGAGD